MESQSAAFLGLLARSPLLGAAASLLLFIVVWRHWKFTLCPRWYPDEPKTYPYWIPFMGHTISFFRDAEDTMEKARVYFGNKREPFQLIIMGEIVYVITSAQDTAAVYKNDAFSMNPWLIELMSQFGASPPSVKAMWSTVRGAEKPSARVDPAIALPKWEDKPLKEVCVMVFRSVLNPGQHLEDILDLLLSTIHERMSWDAIPDFMVESRSGNTCDVSLLKWSQHVLLEGATRCFFGDSLMEIEPDLFDSFFEFDDSSWKLPYQIPAIFARDVQRAKRVAETALAKYFDQPAEKRKDASILVHSVEKLMRISGIQSTDIGVLMLMFYWVINANAWKAAYWMLAEIVNNPPLRETILEEISPFISPSGRVSGSSNDFVLNIQNCPTLAACYHEALRIASASTSVRNVLDDTKLGRFRMRKGGRMVIPYRQMMLDEDTFGKEPKSFKPERFLQNPGLLRSANYKPFGGGSTLCPGRALAEKEILTFAALAIGKFGIKRAQVKNTVPQMNTQTPCIGIMGPVAGQDIMVTLSKPEW